MRYETLLYDLSDGIAEIRLNRPQRLNAVTQQLYDELNDALGRAEAAREARVVLLTGEGRAFCVGADLKEHKAGRTAFDRRQYLKGEQDECPAYLKVLGREVVIARTDGGLARATFAELCEAPLGPQDYLAVAERFHTLFLEDVPVLGPDNHQAARRFVTLVDALYEAGTRLVVLAGAAPEALYQQGIGAFEFERTVSRLNEMSGADWLARQRTA